MLAAVGGDGVAGAVAGDAVDREADGADRPQIRVIERHHHTVGGQLRMIRQGLIIGDRRAQDIDALEDFHPGRNRLALETVGQQRAHLRAVGDPLGRAVEPRVANELRAAEGLA